MGWLRKRRGGGDADRTAPDDARAATRAAVTALEELAFDTDAMAEEFVALHGGRPDLDGSLASLRVVDDLLGERHERGEPLDPHEHWLAGVYVMECARRSYGGEYLAGPSWDDPLVLVVGRPEFEAALGAISKVAGRVRNGPEDDLPFFVDGLADLVRRRQSGFII